MADLNVLQIPLHCENHYTLLISSVIISLLHLFNYYLSQSYTQFVESYQIVEKKV